MQSFPSILLHLCMIRSPSNQNPSRDDSSTRVGWCSDGICRALAVGAIYGWALTRHSSDGPGHADYRHVIRVLAAKPQAFRYSQLRDDLLPSDTYKQL